jgi:N-acetylmuramic acid 6-phosphate (MurNAc-6-P) etherase
MLAVDPTVDQVVLAGGNAALRAVAEALAEDDPQRGRRAAMALAAHVLALLDDTAAKGNRPDQLRVLEEWLVPP